jgi:predicted nucleotidyltransferase
MSAEKSGLASATSTASAGWPSSGRSLKRTARPEGDIDLLVEFEREPRPTPLDLAAMEEEISCWLGGRRVELRTAAELSRYFRSDTLCHAEVRYVTE